MQRFLDALRDQNENFPAIHHHDNQNFSNSTLRAPGISSHSSSSSSSSSSSRPNSEIFRQTQANNPPFHYGKQNINDNIIPGKSDEMKHQEAFKKFIQEERRKSIITSDLNKNNENENKKNNNSYYYQNRKSELSGKDKRIIYKDQRSMSETGKYEGNSFKNKIKNFFDWVEEGKNENEDGNVMEKLDENVDSDLKNKKRFSFFSNDKKIQESQDGEFSPEIQMESGNKILDGKENGGGEENFVNGEKNSNQLDVLGKLFKFKMKMKKRNSWIDVTDDSGTRNVNANVFAMKLMDKKDEFLDKKLPPKQEEMRSKVWIGKDYCNFIERDFVDLDNPWRDLIDREEIPRMPWHDVAGAVFGKVARDVARHFIQRWNFTKLQKAKSSSTMPFLLPKNYENIKIPKWILKNAFICNCQVIRSSSEWSAGISKTENSIQNSYTELINNAQHYIYIENQFFVTISNDRTVQNQIAEALYEKILSCHRLQKNFRVYVLIPLLPCFEGQLGTGSGASILAVTHWNYTSICRGNGNSLIERLLKVVPDPFKYITFYCLRKHEEMQGKYTSELIYVHAKLMIIDDRKVIFGSANINDRSLLGPRDSEVGVVFEDTKFTDSLIDGEVRQAGLFSSSLRKSLFREHLGILDNLRNPGEAEPPSPPGIIDMDDYRSLYESLDPVDEKFYKNIWLKTAAYNTSIYSKVFNCIPSDDVLTLEDLNELNSKPIMALEEPEKAKKLLDTVRGHIVLMPLQFLAKENLSPQLVSKEGLVPTVLWT